MAWHHANCFREIFPSLDIEKVSGWDILPPQDKETLSTAFKKDSSAAKRGNICNELFQKMIHCGMLGSFIYVYFVLNLPQGTKDEILQQETSRETKRRKFESDQKISKSSASDGNESSCANTDLERKLEEQNRALWAIKDELKKQVMTAELREMLEVNEQDSAGSEYDLRERW